MGRTEEGVEGGGRWEARRPRGRQGPLGGSGWVHLFCDSSPTVGASSNLKTALPGQLFRAHLLHVSPSCCRRRVAAFLSRSPLSRPPCCSAMRSRDPHAKVPGQVAPSDWRLLQRTTSYSRKRVRFPAAPMEEQPKATGFLVALMDGKPKRLFLDNPMSPTRNPVALGCSSIGAAGTRTRFRE